MQMQSINMKTKTLFTLGTLFCFSTFSTATALSLPPNNCQEHQEVFAFESLPTPTKNTKAELYLTLKYFIAIYLRLLIQTIIPMSD